MKTNSVNVLHPGNQVNDSHVNPSFRHSSFKLSPNLAQTLRFGELTPHFCMRSVPGDHISLRSSHQIRSYTLNAPLMSDIKVSKDYFSVPLQAILPFQFDRIYANPNIGDDVPDDAYTYVEDFSRDVFGYISDLRTEIHNNYAQYDFTDTTQSDYAATLKAAVADILNFLIQAEYFYSAGSLLCTLGYSTVDTVAWYAQDTKRYNFDDVFDNFFRTVFGDEVGQIKAFTFGFDSSLGEWFGSPKMIASSAISAWYRNIRNCIELMRDNGGVYGVDTVGYNTTASALGTFISNFFGSNTSFLAYDGVNRSCDLARLFAYQIVCAHYYSNDKVDYVYSAELYRQNLCSSIQSFCVKYGLNFGDVDSADIARDFTYNGLYLQYDYCSSHFFKEILSYANDFRTSYCFTLGQYLSLIFAFRHSLRFVDYFTGAKTRPLAVGDTSVSVNNSAVSVVDVTRKIQLQRFLNAVNRTGRKISNYVKGLFGVDVAHDFHDPMFLGHVQDSVFGDEVSNTGDAQLTDPNSVTSVLKSNSSRYAFEFDSDRESIVIGISYFDIPRYYSRATDKEMYIADRFDMFNPDMEYIGDQSIDTDEITTLVNASGTKFGYTTRYMEFKQKFMRAIGGFVKNLPGYMFLADNVEGQVVPHVLSPSYIRSSNVELDPFFVSLTGFSEGSYFHFIVLNMNDVSANRPMAYNPQIL